MPRVYQTVTVSAAGTPVCLGNGLTTAVGKGTQPQWVKRLKIQALHGSSAAYGYALTAPTGTVPAHGTSGQLMGEIPPASSTGPGNPALFEDTDIPFDLNTVWVDASHSGDSFVAGYDV